MPTVNIALIMDGKKYLFLLCSVKQLIYVVYISLPTPNVFVEQNKVLCWRAPGFQQETWLKVFATVGGVL